MNIQLKNLKIHRGMSEETTCFEATIYVNGKKAGSAQNSGKGGAHRIYWTDREVGEQVEAYAKGLPDYTYPGTTLTIKMDAEALIDRLIEKEEVQRQYRQWCRKSTVYRTPQMPEGSWTALNTLDRGRVNSYLTAKGIDPSTVTFLNDQLAA